MSSSRSFWLLVVAALWLASGCAGPVKTFEFPQRSYTPSDYAVDVSSKTGLLWGANTPLVIEDNRSRHLGDIVIVSIAESANASEEASTTTSTQSSVEAGFENFFGLVEAYAAKNPNFDKAALIKAMMKNSFQGDGETTRAGNLTATITCQVKQVLPNGDLFIEGGKTIQINREETHLYLSGVVRPYDIDMANTVSSARVLDARIDFSGRGVVSDKQGPGMLHRGMDTVWPF